MSVGNCSIGTWSFSLDTTTRCVACMDTQMAAVDSVVESVKAFEDDPDTGVYVVGRGGFPNKNGIVQLDAAIMNGEGCQFGAVAALEGVATPIAVAHRVMTHSPHSMLVGEGARGFAEAQGFTLERNEDLIPALEISLELPPSDAPTPVSASGGGVWDIARGGPTHDTLGIIALDKNRHIAAGVSSSGMAGKHPGRVGDSPLPGSGLYADDGSGAACCTGDGDVLLRFCPSYLCVQLMGQGHDPVRACRETVARVRQGVGAAPLEMGIIAMNVQGECGAGGTVESWTDVCSRRQYSGFPYSVSRSTAGRITADVLVTPAVKL